MKKTRRSFLASVVALLLCFTMLLSSTFAWFTDTVTSSNNKIQSGSLDLDLQLKDKETGNYTSINENSDPVFDYDNWEPGYTDVKVFKIYNAGSLSLKWVSNFVSREVITKLAEIIDVYVKTSDIDIAYPDERTELTSANGWKNIGTLDQIIDSAIKPVSGQLLPGESDYFAVALHMQEGAGNEYQDTSLGAFDITVHATQYTVENDSFGPDYDQNAQWPNGVIDGSIVASSTVTTDAEGKVTTAVTMTNGKVSATVPAGTQLVSGASSVSIVISPVTESRANVTLSDTEKMLPVDVHIDGVAENNDVPIPVYLSEWLDTGLNIGNYHLYHVENGTTVEMILRADNATPVHNNFDYDPATGDVVLYMASFSEVAMVAEPAVWKGSFEYSWYDVGKAELTIANADQLAAFGAIVGGMADGIEIDSFVGKTVKLLADIDLGDKDGASTNLFHPIGYYYTDDKNGDGTKGDYYSTVSSFEGTFDGNGHTISNFYQNTWEIKGDYDGNYYDVAMGLFGYIVNGTVKNLTVDNFSSDGEFTPTGVIAAYAVNSTFENIAITNCNPRVYNTGNGGIVGIGGNSDDPDSYKLTFNNITIDSTNIISALWGSWDVACGGLVGMFRGAGHVYMTNCHVGAQIDVYNDVCGNYQYYWYRYSGMLVGTNKNMITDEDGYTVPEIKKFHAEKCTVHFGDWNDYYYCELVANSLASYTHDHQFSRLTQIQNVSEIKDANGNWKTTGNFILMNDKTPTDTCYHIMKDANGNLYEHKHDVADATNPNVNETVNGEIVLKENNQRIYLPFNQLFTGYGWGVKHIPIYDDGTPNPFNGVTILGRADANSVVKFEGKVIELSNGTEIKLGDIFSFVNNGVDLVPGALTVTITNLDENNPVSATIDYDRTNWENSTITFTGTGEIQITIQDYYFCTPTTITFDVTERAEEEKFDVVLNNGDFLHRVGNQNAVEFDKLFKKKDGVTVGTVFVTVEPVEGTSASGTYINGTIQFSGTGVVKVTVTDNDYCTPTVLYLEVVDAINVTGFSGTLSGNVVLLNNCGLSSLTVSGRNTVYGNGFTATYTGNGQYLNNGLKQGVITVSENGTLDNLRVVAPVYPRAYMYYGSTYLGDYVQGGPSSVEGDKTRYHYQLSAVVAKGNATISNCYIYGGRTNVFVDTGDVTIENTVLECGTVANVQIQSNASHTITLEDVTTIQYLVDSNVSGTSSEKMLGAGILVGPETTENPKIVLNGEFKQYNWVTQDDADKASGDVAKKIIEGALDATVYNHTINGKTASNLGIIYMNEVKPEIINNTGLPYALDTISMNGVNGQVYSLQNATPEQIYSDYENADRSTVNGFYQPQFKYPEDLGGQYIEKDSGDEHFYREGDTIHVLFPSGDTKEIDLVKLVNIVKYTGQDLNLVVTVKDENGNAVPVTDGKVSLSNAGNYIVTYTVTDTLFYDKDGNLFSKSAVYSWNVVINVSLKDTAVPDARFEFDSTKQKMGYYVKSGFSTSVYQYIPFLAGLKIYDYNGQSEYLRFDGDTDFNKVASITVTNKYSGNDALVVVKLTDGGVITLQLLSRADSGGGSTYTGSIKVNSNTIYFVNDGTTSDKEATTTAAYWYVDYYKFTGNNGVEIQSGQQKFTSTGKSASTPSGNFNTSIKYTVTFDANGGNCGQTVGYATSVATAVTLPTPTRSGYIFAGWYTAASGGTRVGGAGDSYTPSANITLYAQWGKPCTVTYNANGGSCGTASEKYTGTALTLPTATRDGYWFIGWYDAPEGGNKIGEAGAKYNPANEITLYAHWQEKVEYTVTYNANSGSVSPSSATYQGVALTLPTPTRTGYKFLGWYTAASGGTKVGDAGASYTPSANITLYAQWTINSYTIKVTTSNATVKVNGTTVSNNGTVSVQYGAQVTVEVTYSEDKEQSTTIKGTDGTTYNSPFTMPAQNVTINATSSGCVTPDTLVTLADGTQVRVDSLKGDELLLVWNMETGKLDFAPIMFIDSESEAEYEIIHLYFSDGTDVKVIYEHGFWDYDLNKYVYLDRYADKYIGHTFAKQNGDKLEKVQLIDVVIETEITTAWSPVTVGHLCYFVNGMLSMPGGVGGLFNIFEVDPETMIYDYEQLEKDIETYGLFTYEELNAICPLSEEMFYAAGGAYLKISIGKGNLTTEELIDLINRYSKFI